MLIGLSRTEFWRTAKNYAGLIDSEPTRAVYSTLKQSFGQCRVFQDYYEQDIPEEKLVSIFINLVCDRCYSPLAATHQL